MAVSNPYRSPWDVSIDKASPYYFYYNATTSPEDDLGNACAARAKRYAASLLEIHERAVREAVWTEQMNKYTARNMQLGRVYVGNLAATVSETDLTNLFVCFGPIAKAHLGRDPATGVHRGFGFIDFEVADSAVIAIAQRQQYVYHGKSLKVGRPSNVPHAQAIIDQELERASVFNRVFICNVHTDIGESDLALIFSALGPLTSCKLAQDLDQAHHKGYGYIDFAEREHMQLAIESLNFFELAGQILVVARSLEADLSFCLGTQHAYVCKQMRVKGAHAADIPQEETSDHPPTEQESLPQPAATEDIEDLKAMKAPESPYYVIQLWNMVGLDEVDTEESANMFKEEIHEEFSRYGRVAEIRLSMNPATGLPLVSVYYWKAQPDEYASFDIHHIVSLFHGRYFDGNTITATLLE